MGVKIFINIINFNGESQTKNCLDSLEKLKKENFEIYVLVIDNASSKEFIKTKEYTNFKLNTLRSEENLGFSGGHNLGIKYALKNHADYILILNNDVLADENLLIELLKTFQKNKNCGLVSPKIYFEKGYEYHKERYEESELGSVIWYAGGKIDWKNVIAYHKGVDEVDKGQYDRLSETEFASGCCVLVKKEVFEKVGLFEEKYFLYYEDNDFSQRAKKKGFLIYFQPKAKLWHLNAGSAGGSGSMLQDYYITRNRLLFGLKYASSRVKIALIRESFKLSMYGRTWQKKGVSDYYLQKLGKGSFK